MKTDKLRRVYASLPAEAQTAVMELLRQVGHDLQSPLSALTMEAFSIQHLVGQLERNSGGSAAALPAIAALNEISANVERAAAGMLTYLSVMSQLDTDTGEEGPQ
jgi:hypothetical protein